jgi:hypothetical protein
MTVVQLKQSETSEYQWKSVVTIDRLANEIPKQIALTQLRQGVWKAWRWVDVQREVLLLRKSLIERGVNSHSRFVICGAYEPTLLLITLAAIQAGAEVVAVSQTLEADQISQQIQLLKPDFVYLQTRDLLSKWLAFNQTESKPLTLFSAIYEPKLKGQWQVTPVSDLYSNHEFSKQTTRLNLHQLNTAWVDEGTEWNEGFKFIIEQWLENNVALSFPETSESSARDRLTIVPVKLLVSAERVQQLNAEIENRLANPGSLQRRLSDWALNRNGNGIPKWIRNRIRQRFGFQRLREILHPNIHAEPITVSQKWINDYLERAA